MTNDGDRTLIQCMAFDSYTAHVQRTAYSVQCIAYSVQRTAKKKLRHGYSRLRFVVAHGLQIVCH